MRPTSLLLILLALSACRNASPDAKNIEDPPPANASPVVSAVSANPTVVAPGASFELSVRADDPDGDELIISWSGPWSVAQETGDTITLTAPDAPGEVGSFTATATDPSGASASGTVVVTIEAEAPPPPNNPPTIASLAASPPQVAPGGSLDLLLSANDPDGDTLSTTWSAPAGWALSPTADGATVIAPDSYGSVATLEAVVEDGNGGSASAEIVVSTTANGGPIIASITATPASVARGGSLALAVSAADPDGDPLSYTWAAVPTGWSLSPGADGGATVIAPDSPGELTSLQVTVEDADGLQATGSVVVSTLPNTPPLLSALTATPTSVAPGGSISLSASGSDADGDPLTYSWSSGSWAVSGSGDSATLSAPDSYGVSDTVTVTVSDPWGGSASSAIVVSTLRNNPPTVASVTATPSSLDRGATSTISVSASDPDGDPLTYSWGPLPAGWALTPGASGSATVVAIDVPDELASVEVTVSDPDGLSASGSVVLSTRANRAPVLSALTANPASVAPGGSIDLSASVTDADGDPLSWSWSAPSWVLSNTEGSATLTAPNSYGASETVTVSASDPWGGSVSGQIVVSTVANTPPSVANLSAFPSVVDPAGSVSLSVSATDADGDPLNYSWVVDNPDWQISGSGASVSLRSPSEVNSVARVSVDVSDGLATASASTTVSTSASCSASQIQRGAACHARDSWIDLGTFSGPLTQANYDEIKSYVVDGADFKWQHPFQYGAVVPVGRIIRDCNGFNSSCFYLRREYGTGWATDGVYVDTSPQNGDYWLGTEVNLTGIDTFFTGTGSNLGTGNADYRLLVRPGNWHVFGSFPAGQALPADVFAKLRALLMRGVDLKLASDSTSYHTPLRVERVIPDCGPSCMWIYALREDDDTGEKSLGMTLSRGSDTGNYWIGDPVGISTLSNFVSGTSGSISSGSHSFTLYVDDDISQGTASAWPEPSATCADWASKGWGARDACLSDGRWHSLGSFSAGTAIDATRYAEIRDYVARGADFKWRVPGINNAIIPVERIIADCENVDAQCFYSKRESGTGSATIGFRVTQNALNGQYWLGDERTLATVDDFFHGTQTNVATGTMDFELWVRPANWQVVASGSAGVGLDPTTFAKLRALADNGADLKLSTPDTSLQLIHRVVRTIPDCGPDCVWLYARREAPDSGEKSLGMELSTSPSNGNYWVGDPIDITSIDRFFGGTGNNIDAGSFNYTIYANAY